MHLNKVTGLAIAVLILISSLAGVALASIGHGATAGATTSVGRLVASVRSTTTIHSSTVLRGSATTRNATTTTKGGRPPTGSRRTTLVGGRTTIVGTCQDPRALGSLTPACPAP